ncbi:CoA transferase [Crossiella sp. SN42]|uniref:CoA transferase n=1 Tax=Crossiella sp. SN42 TaxID=2944808 RepID=UPI00207C48F4|nr:CoA transferase [Crossiella sp. SN42]MCO1581659.1 CoA transferase [Crossiella sp. SN42]
MSPVRPGARATAARNLAQRQLRDLGITPRASNWFLGWTGPVAGPLTEETTVQAACGIAHVHGRRFGRPALLHVDYPTAAAGVLAALGVLAVRVARARGLQLRRAETSVVQAALLLVSPYLAAGTANDGHPDPADAGGSPFRSADGVCFELAAGEAEGWHRFWTVLAAGPDPIRVGWASFRLRHLTATCPLPGALFRAAAAVSFGAVEAAATLAGVSVARVRAAGQPVRGESPWRFTPSGPPVPSAGRPPRAAPLDGLAVIELGHGARGSLAGHVLSLLGARVIRVEPPGGDPARELPPLAGDTSAHYRALNDGKRVTRLDLSSPGGRADLLSLVTGADVFLHNWTPGRAAQLRLDSEYLSRVRPGLVYASAAGGGPGPGPTGPPSVDSLVQAHSGLAAEIGPSGAPAIPSLMPLTETIGGLLCAQGVLAGLWSRFRHGQGGRVDCSLLAAAELLRGMPRTARRAPLSTEDGWLGISADPFCHTQIGTAFDLPDPADHARLAERCAGRSSSHWLERLRELGVPAVEVCTDLAQLPRDPRFAPALCYADGYYAPRPPWRFS